MTTGILHDQNLEKQIQKQMGCMTGFLHLFNRNQILTGKRLYTAKRLAPLSPALDSASESETNVETPSISTELAKVNQNTGSAPLPYRYKQYHAATAELRTPAPEALLPPAVQSPSKMPLPLPIFDFKEGTKSGWKLRETPRLSLDSRAIVDAKGSLRPREIRTNSKVCDDNENKQHRSPSVIARLMGLDQLPESYPDSVMQKSELQRSASESRVNRDLNQCRFIDANNNSFQQTRHYADSRSNARLQEHKSNATDYNTTRIIKSEPMKVNQRGANNVSQRKSVQQQRKSFFDAEDFFPEPKQNHVSIYGEIEKRLRMRGIDEPSRDLETLKQILDALQLKGLLHSKKSLEDQLNSRNFIYDHHYSNNIESPIVVMKPSSTKSPSIRQRRNVNESPPVQRRNLNSPRLKTASSPSRSESSVTSTSSAVRRKPLSIETPRRGTDSVEHGRVGSPIHSPKVFTRRNLSPPDRNHSPRSRKSTSTSSIHTTEKLLVPPEEESSSISGSMSSQTDSEKRKIEEFKGRNLMDRCDKLLHSIAEMNTPELQPSPVSILDASFYKDDSSSPSPVLKRSLNFTADQAIDFEDEIWSIPILPVLQSKHDQNMDDDDYAYASDMFHALNYFPEESDLFLLLEKHQYHKGKDTSKVCTLRRKIIFDTLNEITYRSKNLPPWKTVTSMNSGTGALSLDQIWSEFKKIRERDESEDLFEVIFGVLRKDLDGDATNAWGDCYMEKSEAVLDIERSIYKDLIGEIIRDLATVVAKGRSLLPRRKLVF